MPTTFASFSDALIAGGIIGGFIGVITLLVIAFYVLLVVADWKIFTKAGEKGWKSLIPFYNIYITFKLFWEVKWFWISLVLSLIAYIISMLPTTNAPVLIAIVALVILIVTIVIYVSLANRMSKSFGHGVGYTLGIIFLPNIFTLILAFNKDKYKKLKD